jgi:aromatic ring-opening dioxygenase LigB subunit
MIIALFEEIINRCFGNQVIKQEEKESNNCNNWHQRTEEQNMNIIVNGHGCRLNEIEFLSFHSSIEKILKKEMKNLKKSCQCFSCQKGLILTIYDKGN